MAPPPNLRKYLFVVRATSRPTQKKFPHSKTAQTDEEKQRERQRSENEHKKLEQEAINYKRDKESREARLLDLEIRRANEKDRRLKQQQQQYQLQQQQLAQSQQHSIDSQQGTSTQSNQYHQQILGQPSQHYQQQHPQTHLTHHQLTQSEKSTPTSGVTYVSEIKSPYADSSTYDRSIPRAFRSRSSEKEKEALELRRREIAEAGGSKAVISTTPSPQTATGPPPSRSVVAGPPATAAAATAAIIPILPLGVATLRDDSTESDQSLTYPPPAHPQPDAYHRIM
ncbi:cytoplasmic polyadenylation element-binding protein-like isoform X1 [Condylostylus longicornis]|uniref:cytoplasmic polyadenylation element-binding protein-like isoform X1 n=1 Tax=Condylostylus longicornis TaxID=2530218 RepID=UPI00244DD5C3|nr:cytoplasmic polyadenylation element-binding protein-like isoform X1 [Condylostylus longicornis]